MFQPPPLPYGYADLQPHIDEQTMRIHHDKHHATYTTKLNAAVEATEFNDWPIEKLLQNLDKLPQNIRNVVRNNGGGHYNHSLFWQCMSPPNKGGTPSGALAQALEKDLGGLTGFQREFTNAAINRFGSGWAWLVFQNGKLKITSTANQDNPISESSGSGTDLKIILGLDVWEHAYYLKYQNRRPEYVENFFSLINWTQKSQDFKG